MPTHPFHSLTMIRRAATLLARVEVLSRCRRKRSTTSSSTAVGSMPTAEQNRINGAKRYRVLRSASRRCKVSQAAVIGTPSLPSPSSRLNQSSAALALLLVLASVLAVQPNGGWRSASILLRTALKRAGMLSGGRSRQRARPRKAEHHCRRVASGNSVTEMTAAIASAKLGSITSNWSLLGKPFGFSDMDDGGAK